MIGIVGVCCSGKTTLAEMLVRAGYEARSIAQEHSNVKRLWRKYPVSRLVYLDCDYDTVRKRRRVSWGPERLEEQRRRLAWARSECDLYIRTDKLEPREVMAAVLTGLGIEEPGGGNE